MNTITLQLQTNELAAALKCAGKTDVRYYLNGVHLVERGGFAYLESTDGHRALVIGTKETVPSGLSFIIPRVIVEAAAKMGTKARPRDLLADVDLTNREIIIGTPDRKVHGEAIDGQFPDIARISPDRPADRVVDAYNANYLRDFADVQVLLNPKGSRVILPETPQAGSAALVFFDGSPDAFGVIMPMLRANKDAVGDAAEVFLKNYKDLASRGTL